ncbi:hypothetical protein LDENG_00134610 [Lucifuga dentata]|nr:hypothetical protein LDENG_00134610 [Lucifuga dentata]
MTGNCRRFAVWTLRIMLLSGCIYTETDATYGSGTTVGFVEGYLGRLDSAGLQASHQLSYRGHAALIRRKRNILFPSGVKLCTQETVDQAVANHLSYFHLRVCQETVWEAFKVFWDRLPDRDQYHNWVDRCIDGSVSITDIGSFFSQSEEHIGLVRSRVAMATVMNSVPVTSAPPPCSSKAAEQQTEETQTSLLPGDVVTDSGRDDLSPSFDVTLGTPLFIETEGSVQGPPDTTPTAIRMDLTSDPTVTGHSIMSESPVWVTSDSEDEDSIVSDEVTVEVTTEVINTVTHSPFHGIVQEVEDKSVPNAAEDDGIHEMIPEEVPDSEETDEVSLSLQAPTETSVMVSPESTTTVPPTEAGEELS